MRDQSYLRLDYLIAPSGWKQSGCNIRPGVHGRLIGGDTTALQSNLRLHLEQLFGALRGRHRQEMIEWRSDFQVRLVES